MRLSGCGADTTFSTFTGHDSTLLLSTLGRASFQRCSFRDFELSEGIFDVSDGSSVRLENCTFTNITVPNNDYVSTTQDDGEVVTRGPFSVENFPEDDSHPLFDVQRQRANDSRVLEEGVSVLKVRRGSGDNPCNISAEPYCRRFDINDDDRAVQGWTQGLRACR
jgi:hypothetical protein